MRMLSTSIFCLSLFSCMPSKKENMGAAVARLAEMEGSKLDFAGLKLPEGDHIDIPQDATKKQLRGLVDNYLAMNHLTLANKSNQLVLSDTRAYENLWLHDIAEGTKKAKEDGKPLFVKFEADWCEPCVALDNLFKRDEDTIAELKNYTLVRIDADQFREDPNSAKGRATLDFLLAHKIDPEDIPLPLIVLVDQLKNSRKLEGFQGEEGFYRVELAEFRK